VAAEVVSLAERLKERRLELGLSQAQAARELDVARTAYRLWELEAAKPSPDRWRLLSHWLGISVTALLLAEDLVTDDEADQSEVAEASFGRSGHDWDTVGAAKEGDFFVQGHALVADGVASGHITADQADQLTVVLDRLKRERDEMATSGWHSARLRKGFPADEYAASAARQAVSFVAGDIPAASLETAQLLTSELVTNSVKHGPRGHDVVVGVYVEVERGVVRVEISDAAAGQPKLQAPGQDGGYGLALVDGLASRWATDRDGDQNVTWFELDLPHPGNRDASR
jgi:transcriptional regulator with XRE-family HTH domain/anti-sigma regulatory factor (Ser/Thr protein kinase)